MIGKALSQKLVLLVIGLAAGSGILIPASYASFHPVSSSEIQDGTIQTADLANNAVTSANIKDGEVKTADIGGGAVNSAKIADNSITAADLATDSVGAAELQGVTKLLFGKCVVDSLTGTSNVLPGNGIAISCVISGVDLDDRALAQKNSGNGCFTEREAYPFTGSKTGIAVVFINECTTTQQFGAGSKISIIVFDK